MRQDFTWYHIRGESRFVDDIPVPAGTLQALVITSSVAHARIKGISGAEEALQFPGVRAFFTADDIPGENQIGNIIRDEPLLADREVHYIGQPVGILVGEDDRILRRAADLIKLSLEELPPILDAREAYAAGQLITAPRTFSIGDSEKTMAGCDIVLEGRVDSGMQEHVYLECQAALALPEDQSKIRIMSSTQNPTAVQKVASEVLDIPMNSVEVETARLGGAFGGKEDQATPWAVMAALAAWKLGVPVKLILERHEDMAWTGKRHSYSSDYRIGADAKGRILAYEVQYYQNAGAAADLSTAILERTLFHSTGSYHIPHVTARAASCRTNLPPNTAYRGFGGPQAMFVIESAVHALAKKLDKPVEDIQSLNLIKSGDVFPYGMAVQDDHGRICYDRARSLYHFGNMQARVREYNQKHWRSKKGLSLMPVCFGISFTSTFLNQASALVHVYRDGSVGISSGAVEMGQGVNHKLRVVASRVFSLPVELIHIENTNTTRNANTSPTAASSGADMNGNAVLAACREIRDRLLKKAGELLGADTADLSLSDGHILRKGELSWLGWKQLVEKAYLSRTNLSSHAYYATPGINFDREKEKGNAFAYHVCGTAVTEATVDLVRGTYRIDGVHIVHDIGQSLDKELDLGQVEGALAQGIGWMTLEEIRHDQRGRNLAASLAGYKVPDIYSAPEKLEVEFFEDPEHSRGPFSSKAVGEPPFMYGIGTWFALRDALEAAVPGVEFPYTAPFTPERMLRTLPESSLPLSGQNGPHHKNK